ncbi:MAG: MFS transporter [Proteobacteria bacterium]|nr:MFS transporter [Pseudomonadota bacterium]
MSDPPVVGSILPRTVWTLAVVSLLNDAASEMIAPLLPIFLTATLGAGPAIVAMIEALGEAASSVLKLIAGRWNDRGLSGRGLIIGGYGLANLARPLLGFASTWGVVLTLRLLDRVGKGLRTAPRDALLSRSVPPQLRGRAFGLHRAFDHGGAMLGPIVATLLLAAGVEMRTVFLLAGIFGFAVLLTLMTRLSGEEVRRLEPARNIGHAGEQAAGNAATTLTLRWATLTPSTRALLIAVMVLAAAAVPEVMVVLWAVDRGLAVQWVPLLWAAAHGLKALIAWRCGHWVDRYSARAVLQVGWPLRVLALVALAFADATGIGVWLAFALYSAALASTEAAERALLADAVASSLRGTAYGLYNLTTGLAILPGAIVIGGLWQAYGSTMALAVSAAASAVACLIAVRLAPHGAR